MLFVILFFLAVLLPGAALAHGFQGTGFFAGIVHPAVGLDHLLAMVSVGIISAQMGGRAIWSVPLAFVSVMAIGGLFGMQSYDFMDVEMIIVLIEWGILTSVMLLGLAIAMDKKMPVLIAMPSCGFFGFFHGFAHGTEIPDLALSANYIAGFMIGTTVLHIVGVGIGEVSKRFEAGPTVLRYTGAVVLGMGVHLAYLAIMLEVAF